MVTAADRSQVVAALHDSEPEMREAAAWSLGQMLHPSRTVIDDLTGALRPYLDDDGLLFPVQTWLVTASR